jgi:hypothetical protein
VAQEKSQAAKAEDQAHLGAIMSFDREAFFRELEGSGVDEVRLKLASKIYGDVNEKGALARVWVLQKELESARASVARNEALQAEQASAASRAAEAASRAADTAALALDTANRAADAAETQASSTERATRIATAALIVAIVTAILTLLLATGPK